MARLTLGTRSSPLAMWQAEFVRAALQAAWGGLQIDLKVISTSGDRAAGRESQPAAGRGIFTREIELALLAGEIDLAVHSLKDLPTTIPDGLCLAAVPPREDPADALVAKDGLGMENLPQGAKMLCGSPRRAAQLLARRGDLRLAPVRGNIGTRIRKLDRSDAAATVLACAGLLRLGLAERITQRLDPDDFLPAAGQGALGVEVRSEDKGTREPLKAVDHAPSHAAVAAERAFLASLGGGCRMPVGAYGRFSADGKELVLSGLAARPDGSLVLRHTLSAFVNGIDAAGELGRQLARRLLADGADEMLGHVPGAKRPPEGS